MACYPCTHCNKCGMFSCRVVYVCADCGTEFKPGQAACSQCGGAKAIAKEVDDTSGDAMRSSDGQP